MISIGLALMIFSFSLMIYSDKGVAVPQFIIQGYISEETYNNFIMALEESPGIEEVVIKSTGGEIFSAIAIGQIIHKRKMTVSVKEFCISSCANYIFPAAAKKVISKDALIVYHGGAQQKNLLSDSINEVKHNNAKANAYNNDPLPESMRKLFEIPELDDIASQIAIMIDVEKRYYREIGVDERLPTYGQEGVYEETCDSGQYGGFYYDLNTLSEFGVGPIEVEGGEWTPSENPLFPQVYRVVIVE